jgi:hypothetical protein
MSRFAPLGLLVAVASGVVSAPTASEFAARNAAPAVDLALVLAIDASGSIDDQIWRLQMQGYADAFRHPVVEAAVRAGGRGGAIAVTVTQWSGSEYQAQVVDWTVIDSHAAALALAARLARLGRLVPAGATSVSGAIDHAVALLAAAPVRARRQVIDVSGDGEGRDGRPASAARDDALARGIVINGLPIRHYEPWVESWYAANVVAGPGSFLVVADDFDSFAEAVRRKLAREIAGTDSPGRFAKVP